MTLGNSDAYQHEADPTSELEKNADGADGADEADGTTAADEITLVVRTWKEPHDPVPRARILIVPGDRSIAARGLDDIVAVVTNELRAAHEIDPNPTE